MVNLVNILREHWVNVLVPLGFVIGIYMDRRSDEKLTAFRNKSMLYKRLVSLIGRMVCPCFYNAEAEYYIHLGHGKS
ncbi:NDUB1 dehydrogenase, partial [Atractosteus spatula]|nr:NDUB1 dehydrogenase [Atractosteus spatula]